VIPIPGFSHEVRLLRATFGATPLTQFELVLHVLNIHFFYIRRWSTMKISVLPSQPLPPFKP